MKKEKYKGVPKFKSGDICIWIDTSTTINRLVTILNYVITKRNGIIYLFIYSDTRKPINLQLMG